MAKHLGGTYALGDGGIAVNRMGYGAMQLTGPTAWGPPADRRAAIEVVREAIQMGVDHIDTSDYYGPHVANEIIREALFPYPDGLTIVTKVGARRGPDKSWPSALSKRELTEAVQDNLRNLKLDVLDVVNLRAGGYPEPDDASIARPLSALADLQAKGLIRHIGLSNVTPRQIAAAGKYAKIVCVQNHYNLAHRMDDELIADLARKNIAYVPFYPLGGFRPLRAAGLAKAADTLGATPRQVALAWLLQRSPNMLVIAGTSSSTHLRENLAAANLKLPSEIVARLDKVVASKSAE